VNIKLTTKLLIPVLVLLITTPLISIGCQGEGEPLPSPPSPGELSSTLVPNMNLDVYIYSKQESPTTIPAEMVNAPHDIDVESFAVWGVPAEDDFAFGASLTLTSASDASNVYTAITPRKSGWWMLSGNTIYFVRGSGIAAESLKAAISNNDFKYYDDSKSLQAAATLPSSETSKLAAIALAKPSKALIGLLAKDVDPERLKLIDMILKLARLDVIVGGLYHPHQLDIAAMAAETMESGSSILNLDLGMLTLVKVGLPGLVVEPIVKSFLTEFEFTETNLGEFTLYKRSWDIGDNRAIPVLVRIEGNHIFAAASGQESYALTLITSINR